VLSNGQRLVARTLIWAAGVTGAPVQGLNPACLLKTNRYQVDGTNRVAGYENVFAIGDIAQMSADPAFPDGHPQVAQPALQQGQHLGQNLRRLLTGQPTTSFIYKDLGAMATIGRNRAVADLKLFGRDFHLSGRLAWLAWSIVHVVALVGFRNRLIVLLSWVGSYFTQDKGLRYIIGSKKAVREEEVLEKALV